MSEDNLKAKVFISYSWSSELHQKSVVELASRLVSNGVDVVADFWDLKKGHNIHKYMESMVTSDTITKVLLIVDKEYQRKANEGTGGVGIETEIVSSEIYNKAQQDKFIPIIWEKDESGNPYLPVFLKNRYYIDLSSGNERDEYQELVRTIFDKPRFIKPAMGKPPAFIKENVIIASPISFYDLKQAIQRGEINTKQFLVKSFFQDLIEAVKLSKIDVVPDDDKVIEKIQAFLPLLNEFDLIIYDLLQIQTEPVIQSLRNLFEQCLSSYSPTQSGGSFYPAQFCAIQFISQELLLHSVAIFLKLEKFNDLNILINTGIIRKNLSRGELVQIFDMYEHVEMLDRIRNDRLKLQRASVTADLFKERASSGPINFDDLIEADLILFFRAELTNKHWYPRTIVYIDEWHIPTLFLRGEMKLYFNNLLPILSVKNKEDLLKKWEENKAHFNGFRTASYRPINLARIFNLEKLATK